MYALERTLRKLVVQDLITNKLKFVSNPVGAASLRLLPWTACMQILQEQKSVLVQIPPQAQSVNLALYVQIRRSGG